MENNSTPSQVYETDGEIVLRTAKPDDAQRIADYFTANRLFLEPWEPRREAEFFTELGWYQRLTKLSELHRLGLGYYLLITDAQSGDMLGTVSFSNISRFPFHACFVGYSLAEQAQGKYIMTRALKMACDYMFNVQHMHRIMASYMPRNKRSESVLQRLGFAHEGHAKAYLLINGCWEDHHLTALVNPDWEE